MENLKKEKSGVLYGLVLAGGKSTRMKMDKSILNYHGTTQVEHTVNLLQKYCNKVFISNRKDQSGLPGHMAAAQIHDQPEFSDMGPIGGILSAMTTAPEASWIVLACDLPFVTEETLQELITKRNKSKIATAYISAHDQLPEPLCAIWEAQSYPWLLKFVKQGTYCPRKVLINSDTQLIAPQKKNTLDNINNPQEYQQALKSLK
jgi:molybdopterin-guanine dinucleotide biosynthesis protein A